MGTGMGMGMGVGVGMGMGMGMGVGVGMGVCIGTRAASVCSSSRESMKTSRYVIARAE